ncbi:hypothetical protein [Enterococcus casseliflavus]|uniref:hypothetical protein n=1 Tax=Enterococcus casseliflavus TaxID=37734 RepID=UPI0034D183C0
MKEGSYKVYKIEESGNYQAPFSIDGSIDSLSSFIANAPLDSKHVITDIGDNVVATTIGNFLDQCPDKHFLNELLPTLIEKQMSGIKNVDMEYTDEF